MLGQHLPHAGLDGAEVLPDDETLCPLALEGHEGEQLVRRLADVQPGGRAVARRDPEEPEQPHHVVDPQADPWASADRSMRTNGS